MGPTQVVTVLVLAVVAAFVAFVALPGRRERVLSVYRLVTPTWVRRRVYVWVPRVQFDKHRREFPEFHAGEDRTVLTIKGKPYVGLMSATRVDPIQARRANLRAVAQAFDAAGVEYFAVRGADPRRSVLGVRSSARREATRVLSRLLRESGGYFRVLKEDAPNIGPTVGTAKLRVKPNVTAVTAFWYRRNVNSPRIYGSRYGCDIEFWPEDEDGRLVAPRRNPVAETIPSDGKSVSVPDSTLSRYVPHPTPDDEFTIRTVAPFDTRIVGDIAFPIDAVFTWVDGEDPAWQRRKAEFAGTAYHEESDNLSRYLSRDELKYALRSIGMFAPWIRNIYVVTDRQVPTWLNTDVPGLRVVDHTEIFTDPQALPTFNSHAIESQLHHIDGLSEHFLYLNDDMMFASDVVPQDFFEGNGLAKFFMSPATVPPGPPTAEDPPVVAAAKNNRDALDGLLGGAIVRRMKHAPYAVRRSVMYDIEEKFAELYNQTAHSRTRNTTDISTLSSFHHYFAFSKGLSIPGRIRYRYVDLGEPDAQERLEKIAAKRVQQAICLNTTKSEHDGISSEAVNDFLDSYFNVPSKFER